MTINSFIENANISRQLYIKSYFCYRYKSSKFISSDRNLIKIQTLNIKTKGGCQLSENHHASVVNFNNEAVLLDKLSEPETITQLTKLLDRLEEFNAMFDILESFIQRGPEMVDSLNRLVIMMREEVPGLDILEKLENSFQTLNRLQQFMYAEEFKQLEENLLNDDMLKLMNSISRSITVASMEFEYGKPERVGIFTLMRELSNPEIQPAIRFVLNFAKILSKELKDA